MTKGYTKNNKKEVKKKMVNVKCHCCSYSWNTDSKMIFVTCPSCRAKTKRIKDEHPSQKLKNAA